VIGTAVGAGCGRRQTALGDSRGQTIVEFALASTLLFGTIFGIISFAVAVFEYNAVSELAREGARYAAVHGSYSGSVACGGTTSSTGATSAIVQCYLRSRGFGLQVTAAMTCGTPGGSLATCGTNAGVACTAGGVCNNDPGKLVQVNVQQTFRPFTTLIPSAAMTLQSTSQMIIAR
jgi:Flp pilus assembly protein TadG